MPSRVCRDTLCVARAGRFLSASIRFNAKSNGKEAYVTVPGVPVDFVIEVRSLSMS